MPRRAIPKPTRNTSPPKSAIRVFAGDGKPMDRSVVDVGASVLVVSQFTLYGDMRKGRRPSFDEAAAPGRARTRQS